MSSDSVPAPVATATPEATAVISGLASTETVTPSMVTLVGVPCPGGRVSKVNVDAADTADWVPPMD